MSRPVVVVGGGIVGTSLAYELRRRGAETVLVERDLEPQGASAFSFASVSAFDEPQRDFYLLKAQGMVAWRKWAERLGPELGVRFPGELRWAESEDGADVLGRLFHRASGRGYPVRRVSNADVAGLEPAAAPEGVLFASLAPEDGQADPIRAIDALKGAFVALGGDLVVGRAAVSVGDPHATVRVGEDDVEASTVVLAMGAETAAVLDRLGWEIPMDPSPGLLAVTEPVDPFLRRTVYVYPARGLPIHLRQLEDGRVVIGERAQDEVAREPTLEHAQRLLDQAARSFPVLRSTGVQRFTVEWRPMPRDGMPVIGALPSLPQLYVALGHSGVTIAPAVAELVAREITEGMPVEPLNAFSPARFAAHSADAYLSIEEAFRGGSDLYLG